MVVWKSAVKWLSMVKRLGKHRRDVEQELGALVPNSKLCASLVRFQYAQNPHVYRFWSHAPSGRVSLEREYLGSGLLMILNTLSLFTIINLLIRKIKMVDI